ncbi:TPA: hypothetical protein NI644_004643 [Pseudomonas aeruginosa]|uniref:hypothetical protein n=1 Tax=Pseudomonas aeruginosa TaxID=287 RepID=UPI001A1D5BEA|nr:hypothetical protein [Pseudomonas aeruginosa]MBI7359781.1 hypothetical protein [Pseudomonas aeruginosa]MDJ1309747.1 hypothetical protein [Pseudomonas aeruginosa]HCF9267213.1 hypothetical protein [Pseudomonas aeruginosa]HCF9273357.1 hypothetical protein [Pseudomonas aeruginosa]HCF9410386.1 hypothetical protein [Pseudomonas aeruginosa]
MSNEDWNELDESYRSALSGALETAHPAVEQAGGDERAAFEAYRDRRNALLESEGHNPGSKWHVTNAHYPTWEASRAALAQPSPAQAEQAEPERPEVVAWQYRVTAGPQTGWSLWHPGKGEEFERSYTVERRPLMTVAQYDRIVGELRAVIAQLRQHKNDYMDSGQETYRALQNEIREREAEIARLDGLVSGRTAERDAANARLHEVATACATAEQERDAALARVAELERQEPVALANRGLHAFWVKWTEAAAGLYGPGIKLYAAPVVQAQHIVPDVCDGKEQDAFEEWARNEGLDTSCHPMHWLFLDAKTNSARQGWKAALRYVRAQVAAPGKEGV